MGMPLNETWGYMHSDDTSDLGRVCHWDNVSSTDLPTCQVDTCPGHGEFDVLPFPDLIETGRCPQTRSSMSLSTHSTRSSRTPTTRSRIHSARRKTSPSAGIKYPQSISPRRR